jgi:hypothetical protein
LFVKTQATVWFTPTRIFTALPTGVAEPYVAGLL